MLELLGPVLGSARHTFGHHCNLPFTVCSKSLSFLAMLPFCAPIVLSLCTPLLYTACTTGSLKVLP